MFPARYTTVPNRVADCPLPATHVVRRDQSATESSSLGTSLFARAGCVPRQCRLFPTSRVSGLGKWRRVKTSDHLYRISQNVSDSYSILEAKCCESVKCLHEIGFRQFGHVSIKSGEHVDVRRPPSEMFAGGAKDPDCLIRGQFFCQMGMCYATMNATSVPM